MRSNDEEYLDSLLNSAQSNKNPKSAISRMSSKGTLDNDTRGSRNDESGAISELISNSGGNSDLDEIGDILTKLDKNEVLDNRMSDLLDGIEADSDDTIPQFKVGDTPSAFDTRDPEEIALDEAIADAERMDAEIQSGKFDEEPVDDSKPAPIVDIEEGDDALLEMAPEVILPEDNMIKIDSGASSDAKETPEQILTDLLDDMPGGSLTDTPEDSGKDSLSEALDNIQEENFDDVIDKLKEDSTEKLFDEIDSVSDSAEMMDDLDDLMADMDKVMAGDNPSGAAGSSDGSGNQGGTYDDISLDNLSLDDLVLEEQPLEALSEEIPQESAETIPEEITEPASEENAEIPPEEPSEEVPSIQSDIPNEEIIDAVDTVEGEEIPDLEMQDISSPSKSDDDIPDFAEMEAAMEAGDFGDISEDMGDQPESDPSLDEVGVIDGLGALGNIDGIISETPEEKPSSGDEIDLDSLEANLDDLLNVDAGSGESTEGEVAELDLAEVESAIPDLSEEDAGAEDTSIPDLDALMNSLANDEIEDIESTAHKDEEVGVSDQEELPGVDLMDALTEEGLDDGMEPSLEELAAIPERKTRKGDEDGGEGKPKKEKKGLGSFFAKLFTALTKEDEEEAGELASLTDENQTVLNELAGDEKPKKEKKKKEKKQKEKKPPKEKKPKKEKPPKPKKEKKPKPPKDPGVPEKAMSPKKIAISGIFAASIGILFMIPVLVLPDRFASQQAEAAYAKEEYQTAYKMLYGKELNEEQQEKYEKARVNAWADRYLTGYNNYVAMNMDEEALDMLLMAMRNKSDLLEEAAKFGVEKDVQNVYDEIESLLSEKYGLSESDVSEINSIKKEREYTIRLMEIVGTL